MTKASREKKAYTVQVPDDVKDHQAYKTYSDLCNSPELNEKRYYQASDDEEYDLLCAMNILRKTTAHLSDSEQTKIQEEARKRRSIIGKISVWKRKAYGLAGAAAKHKESFLDKLINEKSAELIELFGRYFSITEVHKICVQDWGYDVTPFMIRKFYEQHQAPIKEKQEVFKRDFSDLRLGYKRSRLDEYHFLYNNRRQKYIASDSREDYKLLLSTLDAIRKEVEGDKIVIEGNMDVNIQHTIVHHIQKELLQSMSLNTIVLTRICGKQGIAPEFLLAKLSASYYNKFNSFINEQPDYNGEVVYPSEQVYDMDRIKQLNEGRNEIPTPLRMNISDKETDKGHDLKTQLIQRILAKQQVVNDSLNKVMIIESAEAGPMTYDPTETGEATPGRKIGRSKKDSKKGNTDKK